MSDEERVVWVKPQVKVNRKGIPHEVRGHWRRKKFKLEFRTPEERLSDSTTVPEEDESESNTLADWVNED